MRLDLPEIKAFAKPDSYSPEVGVDVLSRWNNALRMQDGSKSDTIDLFDYIGDDGWGGGITAKWMADQLRGKTDVTVNVNSPGGDYFEGLAIYNVLRMHPGEVTINGVGLVASAASLLFMAGNRRRMAESAMMMIHNVWALVIGDRHDLQDTADLFEKFDVTAAEVYAKASGTKLPQVSAWMDDTTWFTGKEAVANGLADGLLEPEAVSTDAKAAVEGKTLNAIRQVDAILGQAGKTRSERRALLNSIRRGTQDAAAPAKQDAGVSAAVQTLRNLTQTISR